MKKFITKFFVFFLPFIVILFYMALIFFSTNMFKIFNSHQFSKFFILGEPYSDNIGKEFKLNYNLKNTKIVSIGSSRVLQFSSDMFNQTFFNCGYLASNIHQQTKLIEDLDLKNKIIILGLDQWEFNKNWSSIHDTISKNSSIYSVSTFLSYNKIVDIFKGKVFPVLRKKSVKIELIGSSANFAFEGFLNDGSFYYGSKYHGILNNIPKLIGDDFQFVDTKNRIKNGNSKFEYGNNAYEIALKKLEDFIFINKMRNNKLIIFFPPFPPSINKLLFASNNYRYINDASLKISDVAKKHSIPFFDFTNFNSTDEEFVDGFHGGKKVYFEILKQMNLTNKNLIFLNSFESIEDSVYAKERVLFFKN